MSHVARPRAAVHALAIAAATGALAFTAAPAHAQQAEVDIGYEEFTLPNGLKVIVHTDRKAPVVAVNLW